MSRELISTGSKWEPIIGYSRAVKVGNQIFVSGTTGTNAEGKVAKGDLEAQVKQAALAWVPQAMRFCTAEPTEVAEGTDVAVAAEKPAAAGECDAPQGTASEGDDAAAGVDGRDPLEEIGQAA